MSVLDRIKNFFYEEEEIEVPKKEVNKNLANKKSKEEQVTNDMEDIVSERELFKSESTFKFPVIFEDEDFSKQKSSKKRINVLDVENNKFKSSKSPGIKKFVPSPIISPVYGILNKEQDEKNNKNDMFLSLYNNETNNEVNIDSVMRKIYGKQKKELNNDADTLIKEDVLEKKEEINLKATDDLKVNPKEEKKEDDSIDLFKNLAEDIKQDAIEDIPSHEQDEDFKGDYKLSDEARLKSIDELLANTDEQDFYKLVDSMYEKEEE